MKLANWIVKRMGKITDEEYLDLAMRFLETKHGDAAIYYFQQYYTNYRVTLDIRVSVDAAMKDMDVHHQFQNYLKQLDKHK